MNWRAILISAAIICICGGTVRAQEADETLTPAKEPAAPLTPTQPAGPLTPAQQRLEALKLQLQEAKAQFDAAQEKLDAAESAVNEGQQSVIQEYVDAARTGDEAAIQEVLTKLGGGAVMDYQWAAAFKGQGIDNEKVVRILADAFRNPDASYRSKFCWLLGENGSEQAAAALRTVLATEKEADVIGAAIAALSKFPDSPANTEAVRAFVNDERIFKEQIGFYARGTLRVVDKNDRTKVTGGQTLKLMAQEYVNLRDAAKAATVPGEVTVETPSLFCAGFQWNIEGDSNRNCAVNVAYRKTGAAEWTKGFPFLRCRSWDSSGTKYMFDVGNMLAGSIFDLEPGTEYEVKLVLSDPDGGAAEKTVKVTTRTEPPAYAGERTLHVAQLDDNNPGPGTGTQEDPFRGLLVAEAAAQPGDVLLIQPGMYVGPFAVTKSGEEGKPIVWRGTDRAKVIISGNRKDECVAMTGRDYRWFEDLSFVGASQACLKTYGCQYVVVRRCTLSKFSGSGIIGAGKGQDKKGNEGRNAKHWFVTDNVVMGGKSWAKDRGSNTQFGIGISGSEHVIAWNKVQDMWDCISLGGSHGSKPDTGSLDVCYNDLAQGSDDGIEADYIFHNTRIYRNRLTNTFSSLSSQPTYGGPTYMLYNAMQNTGNKPFKLHVNSTGVIIAHNTCTAAREAFYGSSAHDAYLMNNLLLGTGGEQGYWLSSMTDPLTMDYTGYNVAASTPLIKHNNIRYRTMADFTADTGIMKHAVKVDWDVFAADAKPAGYHKTDKPNPLQLRPGSVAVDAGVLLPGINDKFTGAAPDLGCYELGKPVPRYGPR